MGADWINDTPNLVVVVIKIGEFVFLILITCFQNCSKSILRIDFVDRFAILHDDRQVFFYHEKSIEPFQKAHIDKLSVKVNDRFLLLLSQIFEYHIILLIVQEVVLIVIPFVFQELGDIIYYILIQTFFLIEGL